MPAYYNEFDPKAAAWLRELIAGGHIAPGDVDERDIRDVGPDELRAYDQCHFFAGIGGWSLALRRAGWSDTRGVWTGSCPCQPFSAAGKRGGTSDERHLWPAFYHLIEQCRPPVVFGEQVASKDGLGWFDLVSADLEGSGYAVGASDLCAAGVGAPHIRQRLWFVGVADAEHPIWRPLGQHREDGRHGADGGRQEAHGLVGTRGEVRGLADPFGERGRGGQQRQQPQDAEHGGAVDPLEHTSGDGRLERGAGADGRGAASGRGLGGLADRDDAGLEGRGQPGRKRAAERLARPDGVAGGVADADGRDARAEREQPSGQQRQQPQDGGTRGVADAQLSGGAPRGPGFVGTSPEQADGRGAAGFDARVRGVAAQPPSPGPVNGFWRDADWLYCRDGKWRPVEPGTFPLAHGIPGRVGLLRGYGNAIVPEAAQAFIEAYLDIYTLDINPGNA